MTEKRAITESEDDRERIAAILQLRDPGNMWSTCERDADAILAAGFSRAASPDAATELVDAIRWTVEYVGNDVLPALKGWSWFDALMEHAPEVAQSFVDNPIHFPKPNEAEAERDAALAAIERLNARHRKIEASAVTGDCATEECEHEDECPTEVFEVCAACWNLCESADPYFGERGIAPVLWPCEIATALDGAPEPEGRWEYRGRLQSCGYVAEGYISAEHAMNGLKVELEDHPYLQMDDTAIVERARVREWLPVEGEKP